ncbi:MAG: ABC transporter permease [Verrucomicrobia bacterium]|nr:ABC transporter permease [Verrucomicrobiota bacterium]
MNPILRRELLAGLRSAKIRWILPVYLIAPFVAMIWVWPVNALYYGGSFHAQAVWWRFLGTQLWMVTVLTPVFAAYTVSSEFEQGTAEFLWTTMIPSWQIILSKMLAVVLLCVALQIVSMPALSLVFFLGGVGADDMALGFSLLLAATIGIGSVALCFSTLIRKGHAALIGTYCVITAFAMAFGIAFLRGGRGEHAVAGMLTLSFFFFWIACANSGRPVGEKARTNVKPIDDPVKLRKRRRTWPYYLVDPLRRIPPIPDHANLVAEQDHRVHPLRRTGTKYRCMYLMPLLSLPSLLLATFDHWGGDSYSTFLWWLNMLIAGAWVVLSHAVALTMDQEMQTLDGLRLTDIGPDEFLRGKYIASFQSRKFLVIEGVVIMAWIHWVEHPDSLAFVIGPISWWVCLEMLGLIAFAVSSFCSKTAPAIALNLGVCGAILVLTGVFRSGSFAWGYWVLKPFRWFLWVVLGVIGNFDDFYYWHSWAPWQIGFFILASWMLGAVAFLWLAKVGIRRKWRLEALRS